MVTNKNKLKLANYSLSINVLKKILHFETKDKLLEFITNTFKIYVLSRKLIIYMLYIVEVIKFAFSPPVFIITLQEIQLNITLKRSANTAPA